MIEGAPAPIIVAREAGAARLKRWGGRHRLAILLGIMLLGLIGAVSIWQRTPAPVAAPPPFNSLAVLPFKSLQSDGDDEHLRLGLADTLITKLGGLRQLIVRPTSAVRKYNHPEQDPLVAGREQGVEAPELDEALDYVRDLAQSFGAQTIAESVENEPTRAALQRLGIRNAQGMHLGSPRLSGEQ